MQSFRYEPPVVWEITEVSYEKGNATEGVSRKINEVKAKTSGKQDRKFTRQEVIDEFDQKKAKFLVSVAPKPEVTVVPKQPTDPQNPYKDRYLRSDADDKLADNLGKLPEYDAHQERLVKNLGSK